MISVGFILYEWKSVMHRQPDRVSRMPDDEMGASRKGNKAGAPNA